MKNHFKLKIGLVFILVLMGISAIYFKSRYGTENEELLQPSAKQEREKNLELSKPSLNQQAQPQPNSPKNEAPPPKGVSTKVVISQILIEQVRREMKSSPMGEAPGLILFAQSLAAPMENAMNDESIALGVFEDLFECAVSHDDKIPTLMRAVCATNAQRLGVHYPKKLGEKLEALKSQLPPSMNHVLKAFDRS